MQAYNIVDVRDVAEAQLRIAESSVVQNGDRYSLVCHGDDGYINLNEVATILRKLFPGKGIGSGIYRDRKTKQWKESGRELGSAPCVLEKCITQLGMTPIEPVQTLLDNALSQISMGLVTLRDGADNWCVRSCVICFHVSWLCL